MKEIDRRHFLRKIGLLVGAAALVKCKFADRPTIAPTSTPARQVTLTEKPQDEEPLPSTPSSRPVLESTQQLQPVEPTKGLSPLKPSPKPEGSKTPEEEPKEYQLFDSFLKPFIQESNKVRSTRKSNDPEYLRRVDEELNSNRVNFVIISRGITHEPPTERAEIASMTIYSFDYVNGTFSTVTLTHDLRAPEVERKLMAKKIITGGQRNSVQKLDQAILNPEVGGFDLTRLVLENATGLCVDFQTVLHDTVIQRTVDRLFGRLEVDVPVPVTLIGYYIGEEKFPRREFKKGIHCLTGSETVGFIKAIPTVGPGNPLYDVRMENAHRQSLIMDSILNATKRKLSSTNNLERINFLRNLILLVDETTRSKELSADFDPMALLVRNFGQVINETIQIISRNQKLNTNLPPKVSSPYIVDPSCNIDGNESPVHWVDKNHLGRIGEKNNDDDLRNGVYPIEGMGFEVPFGGNPHGDLVTEYWQNVRAFVRKKILSKGRINSD